LITATREILTEQNFPPKSQSSSLLLYSITIRNTICDFYLTKIGISVRGMGRVYANYTVYKTLRTYGLSMT
jgi:hypothetical protein